MLDMRTKKHSWDQKGLEIKDMTEDLGGVCRGGWWTTVAGVVGRAAKIWGHLSRRQHRRFATPRHLSLMPE